MLPTCLESAVLAPRKDERVAVDFKSFVDILKASIIL